MDLFQYSWNELGIKFLSLTSDLSLRIVPRVYLVSQTYYVSAEHCKHDLLSIS